MAIVLVVQAKGGADALRLAGHRALLLAVGMTLATVQLGSISSETTASAERSISADGFPS
jgi:hypothetical protein